MRIDASIVIDRPVGGALALQHSPKQGMHAVMTIRNPGG
jgi:hypothetical protein